MPTPKGKTLIKWETAEYPKYSRGKAWYVVALVIGLLLLAYALIITNFLFAIIVLIFGIIVALQGKRGPDTVQVEITETGLAFGDRFMPYQDIDRFAIVYDPPEVKHVYFEFKSGVRPRLGICLEDQNPVKVREVLDSSNVREDAEWTEEPATDTLARLLKI